MSIGDPMEMTLEEREACDDTPAWYHDGEHCQDCGEAHPADQLKMVGGKLRCPDCASDVTDPLAGNGGGQP